MLEELEVDFGAIFFGNVDGSVHFSVGYNFCKNEMVHASDVHEELSGKWPITRILVCEAVEDDFDVFVFCDGV